MIQSPAVSRQAVDGQGNGLRVDFSKPGDRFGHTVFRISAGEAIPVFYSIEGTAEDFAPPSPPFTELHQQPPLSFLSGATSIAHWSMSIEMVERRLVFDVACRMKAELANLGSVYRVVSKQYREALDFDLENAELCELDGERIRIVPNAPLRCAYPVTVQWRYSITHRQK